MNLQVVYCNHQTANLSVRGRLGFSVQDLPRAYEELRRHFPRSEEWVVLSTCNRVELYTAQESPENAPTHRELAEFIARFHNVPMQEFYDDLLERTGPEAVRHLFLVASSLDSMVLGEPQIVAQVKEAYALAQQYSTVGALTNPLFQRAFNVAKRIRTETALAEGRVSIASVAVGDFGKSIFDRFDDKTVLVIGAGEMAAETLRYLKDEGASRILVTNRTSERAQALAETWGGTVVPFERLDESMAAADVIVSTTGAEPQLVGFDRFRRVRSRSGSKTVFILDLAVPRDFDPRIRDLDDNVFLYCIDDLEAICRENRRERVKEVEKGLLIVDQETERFMTEVHHRATVPIIKQLREQWRDVVGQETARLFARLPHLEPDRPEIERTIEQIVNKLLHPPMEALRDEASRGGTPHGLMDALKRLFLGEGNER